MVAGQVARRSGLTLQPIEEETSTWIGRPVVDDFLGLPGAAPALIDPGDLRAGAFVGSDLSETATSRE